MDLISAKNGTQLGIYLRHIWGTYPKSRSVGTPVWIDLLEVKIEEITLSALLGYFESFWAKFGQVWTFWDSPHSKRISPRVKRVAQNLEYFHRNFNSSQCFILFSSKTSYWYDGYNPLVSTPIRKKK